MSNRIFDVKEMNKKSREISLAIFIVFFSGLLLPAFVSENFALGQETAWQPGGGLSVRMSNVAALKVQNRDGEDFLGVITYGVKLKPYSVTVLYKVVVPFPEVDAESGKQVTRQRIEHRTKEETRLRVAEITPAQSEVPLSAVQLWSTDGKALSLEKAREKLAKPTRCFLISRRGNQPAKYTRDPFFTSMLKDNVVIASYDMEQAKLVKSGKELTPGSSWMPGKSLSAFSMNQLATVETILGSKGVDSLAITLFPTVFEEYTEEYPLTVQAKETVTDPKTGKKTERMVPKTEYRSVTKTRGKIVPRRLEIAPTDVKFWTVGGKLLTPEETQGALATKRRCLRLLDNPGSDGPGDPFFSEMFTDDVLLVWFDGSKAIPAK